MLKKRIIPCLDIKDGRVVKGVNFIDLKDAGDPVEIAKLYNDLKADEIVFLDIAATLENRKTMYDVIKKAAKNVFIPLTVGGGISSIEDISKILNCGADKISINSAAIKNQSLISTAASKFGSQCIVVAIDVKFSNEDNKYYVYIEGGSKKTDLEAISWAKKVEELGAGEILLTSMDKDGTKSGYDLNITKQIVEAVSIPVIASGGAGNKKDFLDVFKKTDVHAALAASLFHFREIEMTDLKTYLKENGVEVR